MKNKLQNWTYEHVTAFLEWSGFEFYDDVPDIGKAWMNFHHNGEPNRIVEVKYAPKSYTEKALRQMIRQSGIDEDEWIKWANS